VHVIHNWSWNPTNVTAPAPLSDLLDGTNVPTGMALSLGPWDVRVFVERPPTRK